MNTLKIFFTTTLLILMSTSIASASHSKQNLIIKPGVLATTFSDIKNHDYVCTHITKSEALVFKTSSPQKIWRTTIDTEGKIKTKKAFELSKISINANDINNDGKVASFKASLAKDYEIKGLFEKDTDGELPLTVVSSYIPDGRTSRIEDHYNCEMLKSEINLRLGSINKE